MSSGVMYSYCSIGFTFSSAGYFERRNLKVSSSEESNALVTTNKVKNEMNRLMKSLFMASCSSARTERNEERWE
jgi:hypothetical protein